MVTVNLHPEGKGYLVYGDERIEEDTLLPRVTSITDILDKFGLRNYKMEQALEFVGDTLKENRNVTDPEKTKEMTEKLIKSMKK